MSRCRGIMRSQRLISPRVLQAKNLGPTQRPKSRRPTGLRPFARPSLAGRNGGVQMKPRGLQMQLKLLRPREVLPLAVEANRLLLPTPVADARRRKPRRQKEEVVMSAEASRRMPHHLVEDLGLTRSVALAPEDPIKFDEKDEPGEVRGRTGRSRLIGRPLISAEW